MLVGRLARPRRCGSCLGILTLTGQDCSVLKIVITYNDSLEMAFV